VSEDGIGDKSQRPGTIGSDCPAVVALGLGSRQIAVLFNVEVNELVEVDGEGESVISITTIGRPEKR
jgi:hypothetical protein